MAKAELEARLKEINAAIDAAAANHNALVGRRDEVIYMLSKLVESEMIVNAEIVNG